jgi:hypothetical protein
MTSKGQPVAGTTRCRYTPQKPRIAGETARTQAQTHIYTHAHQTGMRKDKYEDTDAEAESNV